MYDMYVVREGDTIDSIANRFGVSSDLLREINPNASFEVNSSIVVPVFREYFDVYMVNKGDTLYSIAKEYNTDYNLLAMLNGIDSTDYIYPNTSILVPKRDVKYYFTKDNDTLFTVNGLLGSDLNRLLNQNRNIYLREGQLIVYKD